VETALACFSLSDLSHLAPRVRANGWAALRLEDFRTVQEREAFERLLGREGARLGVAPFSRVYFGHESCEHLYPAPPQWDRALALAHRLGLAFSAVLPPTYACREDLVESILQRLERAALPGTQVVCAEWGTLAMVRAHAGLVPVAGRLMNRMKRFERWGLNRPTPDLRGLEGADAPGVLTRQVGLLAHSPLELDETRDRLRQAGVGGLEADPVPQGLAGAPDPGLPLALHVPWSYVTSGRACVTRELVEGTAAARGGEPCPIWCRHRYVLSDQATRGVPVIQKGNAVYQENTRHLGLVPEALRDGARWVVRPFL
jgi:hypothetical protein